MRQCLCSTASVLFMCPQSVMVSLGVKVGLMMVIYITLSNDRRQSLISVIVLQSWVFKKMRYAIVISVWIFLQSQISFNESPNAMTYTVRLNLPCSWTPPLWMGVWWVGPSLSLPSLKLSDWQERLRHSLDPHISFVPDSEHTELHHILNSPRDLLLHKSASDHDMKRLIHLTVIINQTGIKQFPDEFMVTH